MVSRHLLSHLAPDSLAALSPDGMLISSHAPLSFRLKIVYVISPGCHEATRTPRFDFYDDSTTPPPHRLQLLWLALWDVLQTAVHVVGHEEVYVVYML